MCLRKASCSAFASRHGGIGVEKINQPFPNEVLVRYIVDIVFVIARKPLQTFKLEG